MQRNEGCVEVGTEANAGDDEEADEFDSDNEGSLIDYEIRYGQNY